MKQKNQCIIVFSGKKQSGKTSAANFVLSKYLNASDNLEQWEVTEVGELRHILSGKILDLTIITDFSKLEQFWRTHSVKVYSFADPLKEFLINVFGLDERQCYGTDEDKNSLTQVSWDDQFKEVRKKYAKRNRRTGRLNMATGYMTARELMQVFGSDWCRKIDNHCWPRALYAKIQRESYDLAIVTDARFPNEITMGTEIGARVVRLTRDVVDDKHISEVALDKFPLGEYSLIINNQKMNIYEKNQELFKHLQHWFKQHGIA